ncbi:MAG TPA: DUF1800 domain-containing protein, partial [Candidatus Dormibacteraeota bacterium]|nr:DUF1800 domain-containing protein [Candidatus Dormibacteraeota bacterium]
GGPMCFNTGDPVGVAGQPFGRRRLDPARLERFLPRRVTRRHVIGGALAVGAGVSALRLLGLDRKIPSVRSAVVSKTDGKTVEWTSPLAQENARIAHLLRRATFGAGPDELEAAFKLGYGKVVDQLVEAPPAEPPALPGNSGDIGDLQQWWVDHMLATPTPFAERMTLFWHGHFTSDYRKVGTGQPYLYWQNLTWRKMALSNLASMLMQVTTDPAMMRYLDLATSTAKSPNENYSRELLELFTMGPGNFAEGDVRAAASALAGWRLPVAADNSRVGIFEQRRAYGGGPLTFLGRTGRQDLKTVIDGILASDATATFLVTKVVHHFVSPAPQANYIRRLADEFRTGKYDFKTLMRSVFLSPEFISSQSYRSLIKSPIEYMISALKALKAQQLSGLVLEAGEQMGQMVFDPPDVGGWPNNDSWISSSTLMARINFAVSALSRLRNVRPAGDLARLQLDGVLSPVTTRLLDQASDDRTRWMIVLMAPEFNLK